MILKSSRADLESLIRTQLQSSVIIKELGKVDEIAESTARNKVSGRKVDIEMVELAASDLGFFTPFDSDILISILTSLNTYDRLKMVTIVSKGFNSLCSNQYLWREVHIGNKQIRNGEPGLDVDPAGLKRLTQKICAKKANMNLTDMQSLHLSCNRKGLTSTNFKTFLKAVAPFIINVSTISLTGGICGSDSFLSSLPFTKLRNVKLQDNSPSASSIFSIFKNSPDIVSFSIKANGVDKYIEAIRYYLP